MKLMGSNGFCGPIHQGRYPGRRLALSAALMIPAFAAPILVGLPPAHAVCSPPAANNIVVVCTGVTDGVGNGFGFGVNDNVDFTVQQGASVTGNIDGVDLRTNIRITNLGTITGRVLFGIEVQDLTSLTNSGTITGGRNGIEASTITTLINSGMIRGDRDGVFASTLTNLTNGGIIVGDTNDGVVATALNTLSNSGTIRGTRWGVGAGTLNTLVNNGIITSADIGIATTTLNSLTNSGTIRGDQLGVLAVTTLDTLTNSGIISGGTFAIEERGAGNTTLSLNAGSVLIGRIDLGGGTNTLNIGEGLSLNSTFESDGGATLVGLGTASGHLVALAPVTGNGNNDVQIIAIDPSAFTGIDDALSALTAGIGQSVQSRQAAVRSDPALGFASRFAAAEETRVAAFSDLGLEGARRLNPNRFWVEGFGAYREERSERLGSDFDHRTHGLVAGVDVPLDALTVIGAMAGFSVSGSENEIDTRQTDATSFYAGLYASTQALGLAWDAALTVGYTDYDQERVTANNLVASGLETARASYGGWFVAPQVTMTREAFNPLAAIGLDSMIGATDTLEQSVTLAYAGLFLDDYTETGTTNPLTLDDRSVHVASARAALALPFEWTATDGARATLRLIGGVEARTQFGDDTVSGRLLGQAVSTTLGDDDASFGGFLGVSGEYESTTGLTAYANAEGMLETDDAWQIAATAGLRIAF